MDLKGEFRRMFAIPINAIIPKNDLIIAVFLLLEHAFEQKF